MVQQPIHMIDEGCGWIVDRNGLLICANGILALSP
jgi:hypothetical protein